MTKKTNSKSDINIDKSNAKTFYLDKPNLVPYANSLINNGSTIYKVDNRNITTSANSGFKKLGLYALFKVCFVLLIFSA